MHSCVKCHKTQNLLEISGSEKLFICTTCINSITAKLDWNKSDIDSSNSICSSCLLNGPSFIDITKSPLQKVCYDCASKITRTGEKKFINIKWESLVKSPGDIEKYNHSKSILHGLKAGFHKLVDSVNHSKSRIESFKRKLIEQIEESFDPHLKDLEVYQHELGKFLHGLQRDVKHEFFKSNLMNFSGIAGQLLRSAHSRNLLFGTVVCETSLDEQVIASVLPQLCKISLLPISDLITDSSILIFIPKATSIFQIYLDTFCFEEINIEHPEFVTKNQACWCSFANGDILYCGGEGQGSASTASFIISTDKKIKEIAKCSPKKNHCLCTYEGNVYCFGGSSDVVERYISFTNTWEKLAQPSESIGPSSAVVISQGILIAPFKRNYLLFYNVRENKYSKIPNTPFSSNVSKLLLWTKTAIYCLSKNKIYKSDLEGKVWKQVGNQISDLNWCSIGSPKTIRDKIYFLLDDISLHCFCSTDFTVIPISLKTN